jgi:DNA-directed RNA polymerase specialized sigma24 family protein
MGRHLVMAAIGDGRLSVAGRVGRHSRAAQPTGDHVIAELYAREYPALVRLAVLLVHDPRLAEETVQDAFVAMHGDLRWARHAVRARAYLRRAVVCNSRSALRRHVVPLGGAVRPVLEDSAIMAALRKLPERQREAVVLRYYGELSEAETAAAMGIARGAVARHLARGMASLRAAMAASNVSC